MSESANIHNHQALSDLKKTLSRFEHHIQSALTAAHGEIARTQAWVQQRVLHWQRQVQHAQRSLEQAQAALDRCRRNSRTAQHRISCSREERAVATARHRLRQAQAQLSKAEQAQSGLETAVNQYRRYASQLDSLAKSHTPRTRTFLEKAIADLERYLAVTSSTDTPSAKIPLLSAIGEAVVAPLPGDEQPDSSAQEVSAQESYQPEKDEVFWCGSCNRQQAAQEGEKCKICGKVTVSWYIDRDSEAQVRRKWEHINPNG